MKKIIQSIGFNQALHLIFAILLTNYQKIDFDIFLKKIRETKKNINVLRTGIYDEPSYDLVSFAQPFVDHV
jgi:hypothetical protein